MTLKVLKIEDLYAVDLNDNDDVNELLEELGKKSPVMIPSFSREGVYCRGEICWIEIRGSAFYSSKKDFDYVLNEYNYKERPLSKNELSSIITIKNKNPRLFKKLKLNKLYCQEIHRQNMLELKRDISRAFL